MVKVLIADDERAILELLTIYMQNEGFECLLANNGQEALEIVENTPDLDIALLDIMMPEFSGIEVLEQIRLKHNNLPVIFISAKEAQSDKINGLLAGADDYVTKPFEPLEIVLRVKALLRRGAGAAGVGASSAKAGDIVLEVVTIDRKAHKVTLNETGEEIKLTSLEFEILYLLATNIGKVYSAEDILHTLWKDNPNASTKTVMVHVSNLRNKIEAATLGDKVIQTVWGVGYKIER